MASRGAALGLFSIPMFVGPIFGPILGGTSDFNMNLHARQNIETTGT